MLTVQAKKPVRGACRRHSQSQLEKRQTLILELMRSQHRHLPLQSVWFKAMGVSALHRGFLEQRYHSGFSIWGQPSCGSVELAVR